MIQSLITIVFFGCKLDLIVSWHFRESKVKNFPVLKKKIGNKNKKITIFLIGIFLILFLESMKTCSRTNLKSYKLESELKPISC